MTKLTIDELSRLIKREVNILDVVSRYVSLRRVGRRYYMGLCPFHAESSPSFAVTPDNGLFYCFGCGASGDVIGFVSRIEGIDRVEAIRMLARELGYDIEDLSANAEEVLIKLVRLCMKQARVSDEFKRYVSLRGFDPDWLIKYMGLGYASESVFSNRGKVFTEDEIRVLQSILVPEGKSFRKVLHMWKNRIIFPIGDILARGFKKVPVGVAGRSVNGQDPKYVNSVFKKGQILYNITRAAGSIRETGCVYVVEGYFDVIRMVQRGYENTVGVMGTSLTKAHIGKLVNLGAKKIVLVFDGDDAGRRATVKALRNIAAHNRIADNRSGIHSLNVGVVLLPKGVDPDSHLSEGKGFTVLSLDEALEALSAARFVSRREVYRISSMCKSAVSVAVSKMPKTLDGKLDVLAVLIGIASGKVRLDASLVNEWLDSLRKELAHDTISEELMSLTVYFLQVALPTSPSDSGHACMLNGQGELVLTADDVSAALAEIAKVSAVETDLFDNLIDLAGGVDGLSSRLRRVLADIAVNGTKASFDETANDLVERVDDDSYSRTFENIIEKAMLFDFVSERGSEKEPALKAKKNANEGGRISDGRVANSIAGTGKSDVSVLDGRAAADSAVRHSAAALWEN